MARSYPLPEPQTRHFRDWIQRHPDLSAALLLWIVATSLMLPYLLQPHALIWPRSGLGTDFLHYRWSAIYHLRQSLEHHGQFPLWYGQVMGGAPIPGNPSISLFYPTQLLFALLPVPITWGFAVQTVLHLWIAGWGGYVLGRRVLGIRRPAALLSGLAMLLMPRLSSNIPGDVCMAYAMMWTPLTLAWAWLALHQPAWKWVILTGMALAGQFLLHIHFFFLTAWVIGLMYGYGLLADWIAYRHWAVPRALVSKWARQILRLGLAAAVCIGLSSINLLPFLSYTKYLSREAFTLSEANHHALSPLMLVTLPMPNPLKFPEWELYVGVLTLALVPLALWHPRRQVGLFWLGLLIFSALFSVGTATPLFSLMFSWVPGFSWLRVPARMWYFGSIALVLLAALALDALLWRQPPFVISKRWKNWLIFAALVFSLVTTLGRLFIQGNEGLDGFTGIAASLGLIGGLAAVFRWSRGHVSAHGLVTIVLIGISLDLFLTDLAYMTPRPVDSELEMPEIGTPLLQSHSSTFRFYAVRHEIPDQVVLKHDLASLEGMNSFQFEPYVEAVKLASGCNLVGFSATMPPCSSNEVSDSAYLDAQPDAVLLGMLNVQYVISPMPLVDDRLVLRYQTDDEYLYENTAVLPRAYGVGTVEVVPDRETLWTRLSEVDPGQVALVEAASDHKLPAEEFFVPADSFEWHPNTIKVSIMMPDDGLLVVSEVWTPGWQATVNGHETQVVRANGVLRGLFLDAGSHEITFRFVPQTFYIGLVISLCTLIVCGATLIASNRGGRANTNFR